MFETEESRAAWIPPCTPLELRGRFGALGRTPQPVWGSSANTQQQWHQCWGGPWFQVAWCGSQALGSAAIQSWSRAEPARGKWPVYMRALLQVKKRASLVFYRQGPENHRVTRKQGLLLQNTRSPTAHMKSSVHPPSLGGSAHHDREGKLSRNLNIF